MRLIGKLIVSGYIETLTGLAIGGSKTDVEIGGIDNNVIKNAQGVPFIPGSSLKGKLRSLLERSFNKEKVCDCGEEDCPICTIFGMGLPSDNKNPKSGPTRLYVRDANLNEITKRKMENKEDIFLDLELTYTEGKWENQIDRVTSKANHPRQQERVPAGSIFDINLVYNIYSTNDVENLKYLIASMRLLEDDYLGGNGSRGYGRVQFNDIEFLLRTVEDYETGSEGKLIFTGKLLELDIDEVIEKINSFLNKG